MTLTVDRLTHLDTGTLAALGEPAEAGLYLDRCQVDTPAHIVSLTWQLITERRARIGSVVDFGAGDGRFALYGRFDSYTGYEIDRARYKDSVLPTSARMINSCAFSAAEHLYDLACGNPPFVRNQDLPAGWRKTASEVIFTRTGVRISGLANAWQYFFMLSIASTQANGLVALVIPYEWVSRPSSEAMRDYIRAAGWDVYVYRLNDDTFSEVLTTSSITIIDKNGSGTWKFFRPSASGKFEQQPSPSGKHEVLGYSREKMSVAAKRGLSPGTQAYLTLTEPERLRAQLQVGRDVVSCITSLKHTAGAPLSFSKTRFRLDYILAGKKCWLIRTDRPPSKALAKYLTAVPLQGRETATCLSREHWWKFTMPKPPHAFIASGYRHKPKIMLNHAKAIAVGSVCGIYGPSMSMVSEVVRKLREFDYDDRVVAHSHGLRKIEIRQINALIGELYGEEY